MSIARGNFEAIGRDFRYAARALFRHRGMTVVAVLSLSLGFGANIAIFSLYDAVLFRWLPVKEPATLVLLSHHGKDGGDNSRAHFANFQLFAHIRAKGQCRREAALGRHRHDEVEGGR